MKKEYMKPTMRVVELQHRSHLLGGSVKNLTGNTGMKLGGSDANYNGTIRSRSFDDWDDEEEE